MDRDHVAKYIEAHGKIVVSINRGSFETIASTSKKTSGYSKPALWDRYQAPDTVMSSKAVVKNNHVSHAVK